MIQFYLIFGLSKCFSLVFITVWFCAVFRYVPDGIVKFKPLVVGSFFTAVLFSLGKFLLETFLVDSRINSIFEASTSVVLMLLFIFYTSLIIYLGTAFIKVYSETKKLSIRPKKHAEKYQTYTERS